MTTRLDRLERAGLIARSPDPADGRAVRVHLTHRGDELAREALGAVLAADEAFLEPLSDRQREAVAAGLKGLLLHREERAERIRTSDPRFRGWTKGPGSCCRMRCQRGPAWHPPSVAAPGNNGRLARWLGYDRMLLPRAIRLAFFVLGIAALSGAYAVSEELQWLVLLALLFVGLPVIRHRHGAPHPNTPALRGRTPPKGVLLRSLAFGVAWSALLYLSPDWGAGLFVWSVMWPWLEVHTHLAGRSIRREGIAAWPCTRPLREAALYGGGVALLVAGVEVASDARLLSAIGNGLGCGAIVGTFTYVIGRQEVRAATGTAPGTARVAE